VREERRGVEGKRGGELGKGMGVGEGLGKTVSYFLVVHLYSLTLLSKFRPSHRAQSALVPPSLESPRKRRPCCTRETAREPRRPARDTISIHITRARTPPNRRRCAPGDRQRAKCSKVARHCHACRLVAAPHIHRSRGSLFGMCQCASPSAAERRGCEKRRRLLQRAGTRGETSIS